MAVKTKSIYEPADAKDGIRVLITRYYPRGVKTDRFDRWLKPLSPSRELLSSYKAGRKNWDQFRKSFLAELKRNPESIQALRAIEAQSRLHDVTLLCYEREGLPCHRAVVRDILITREALSSYLAANDIYKLRSRRKKAASEKTTTRVRSPSG